jgi:hypothetical protein
MNKHDNTKARELEAAYRAARKAGWEAARIAGLPPRRPTEDDRPRLSSRPRKVIAGQIDVFETVEEGAVDDAA